MRWYLTRNGETAGPFEGSAVVQLAAEGRIATGTHIRDDQGGAWMPIEHSPFASTISAQPTLPAKPNVLNRALKWYEAVLAVLLLVGGTVIFSAFTTPDASKVARAPAPERAHCFIYARDPYKEGGAKGFTPATFPTEEATLLFMRYARIGDEVALREVFRHASYVAPGTRADIVERKPGTVHVTLRTGSAWIAEEHCNARPPTAIAQ